MGKFHIGNPEGQLVLVGPAPSRWDIDYKRPLDERTWAVLLDFAADAGFDRDDVLYVSGIDRAKGSKAFVGPEIREYGHARLFPMIQAHLRKVVIALGNVGLCASGVVDKPDGIGAHMGKRLSSPFLPGIEVTATKDCYFVSKSPDSESEEFAAHFRFAKRLYDGDFTEQVPMVIEDILKPEDLFVLVDEAGDYPIIAYDTETTGLDRQNDLVVTMGFANGKRNDRGEYVSRFWAGWDRLKPLYEDHVLDQFAEAFREFFDFRNKGYMLEVFNLPFDQWIVERNLECLLPEADDVKLYKWVTNKYGSNGLKPNTATVLGYPDYDGPVGNDVSAIAARRGRNMYRGSPENEDDFTTLDFYGREPELAKLDKKKGQGYKWPTGLDKKACAYALIEFQKLRRYQCFDAVYTWLLGRHYRPIIDNDPSLKSSYELRHMISRRLLRCQQKGFLMDVDTNLQWSKDLGVLIGNAEEKIQVEVKGIRPDMEEFNPNSGPQMVRLLYGDPVQVPKVDPESLYDQFDEASVNSILGRLHDDFYGDMGEVKQAGKVYSREQTAKNLVAFVKGRLPEGTDFDLKDEEHYLSGLYEVGAKTETGRPAVGRTTLLNLYEQDPQEVLRLILMRNKASKLKGTFVDGIRRFIDSDNILRGEYNEIGTISGRVSSRKPNMMNFVAYARGQLVARPGRVICGNDLGAIEARVAAALSRDQNMLEDIYSRDFHTATACKMFNCAWDDVTPVMRKSAKILNFMIIFQGGADAVALAMGLKDEMIDGKWMTAKDQGQKFIDTYMGTYLDLSNWIARQKAEVKDKCYVETIFGTRMTLLNIHSIDRGIAGHAERVAVNAPIQGSAGEICFYFMDRQMSFFEGEGWDADFVNNTHDYTAYETVPDLCWNEDTGERDKKTGQAILRAVGPMVEHIKYDIETVGCPIGPMKGIKIKTDVECDNYWYGKPDMMKAIDPDFGSEKQKLPWHLITGEAEDEDEKAELAELLGNA